MILTLHSLATNKKSNRIPHNQKFSNKGSDFDFLIIQFELKCLQYCSITSMENYVHCSLDKVFWKPEKIGNSMEFLKQK